MENIKRFIKLFGKEVLRLLTSIVVASIIISIPFIFFADQVRGLSIIIKIITTPIGAIADIGIYKGYGLILLIPYVINIIGKYCLCRLNKKVNNRTVFLFSELIFSVFFFILSPFIYDCDINRSYGPEGANGYFFKAKKDVCYAWLTIPESPLPHSTIRISNADFNTFKVLEHGYAMDDSHVYFDNGVPACLECIQYDFEITKIEAADPNTFMVLNKMYAKDKNSVYCNGIKMNMGDVETFEVTGGNTAKDNNYEYKDCDILSK